MFVLRRWWDRYALRTGFIVLAVGSAWFIRQTQGAAVYEIYQWMTRPLQPGLTKPEQIENAYILELQERIIELENQNRTLKDLVDSQDATLEAGVVAAVIGRSADHWWQQVTLARGSQAGIRVGYVVTGPGGLVGRIVSVTPNTSRALLISDPTSRVGVKVSRSRAMGYMRGQSSNRVVMEFFDKLPDVKPGDVVTTSSYSRLYPKDVPIGRIESLDLTKSPAPEAVIQLSSPISALEWVMVHPFEPKLDTDEPGANLTENLENSSF
ncbi:rod shape-determining protein MreC [Almyronema epifaneia]|uniref:Cell shape-determining protein MreC n=1 Tax=Almyronema epifaneia S1 TaxID=2991925 RepID=A0ABW6I9N4_9CYAN